MESFFDRSPTVRWARDGVLHVYLVAPPDVGAMAAAYQEVLETRGVPHLSRQPARWLHMTVERLNRCRDDLDDAGLAALIDELRLGLARVPAFELQVGPALVSAHTITLDAVPDDPWRSLRQVVRRAAVQALDEDAVPAMTGLGRPHVTVSYCTGPVSIEPHLGALNHVRAGRARWHVDRVYLVAGHQHVDSGTYSWDQVEVFHLG